MQNMHTNVQHTNMLYICGATFTERFMITVRSNFAGNYGHSYGYVIL